MGELIEFASNGASATGYIARPPSGAGPGVLVLQEWWGLVPHITDVCDRFAAEGFVALAPDLYRGETAEGPDEAARLMMELELDQAAKDLDGAIDELVQNSSSQYVGVVGFCMGGGLALMVSSRRPDRIRATVVYYGAVPWEKAEPDFANIEGAILLNFGTKDQWATPEMARRIEATINERGHAEVTLELYDAGHAFFNDSRPDGYDEAAARLSWDRTISFLRRRLG